MNRPLLPAVDAWAMTDVQWMYTGADVVDSDCTKLVEWRQKAHALEDFLQSVLSVHKIDGWKEDKLRSKLAEMHKTLQD